MNRFITALLIFMSALFCSAQNAEVDSLKKILTTTSVDTVKLQAYTDINWALLVPDAALAKNYALQELALAKKINHKRFIAQAYNDMGASYLRMGFPDSALSVLTISLEIRKGLNDKSLIASSLSKISMIYHQRGNYNEALRMEFEALKIYEDLKISPNEAMTLNNISITYEKLNDPVKSLEYSNRALDIHLKNKNEYAIGATYYNMGNANIDLKKMDRAQEYYMKALPYFQNAGDTQNEAAIYNGLGLIARANNKNTEALADYKKAYEISKSDNNQPDMELYSENIAWTLIDLKNYKEAETLALANLKTQDPESKTRQAATYKQLATIYALMNKGDLSKMYIDKYATLNENIYSQKSAEEIANAEKKYETEKKERENKLLQQQNAIKTLENDNNVQKLKVQTQTIFILIGTILIALVIVFWQISLARVKKQKRALETEKKLQQDRERISRDLHDNVGGQLSYVLFSLEANEDALPEKRKEKAQTLANALRGVTGNLRETIWALNQEKLTLKDLSDKLKIYARTIFSYTDTKIKFEENIEQDQELNPAFALNLFRICQEIINNAFKHAHAKELTVTFIKKEKISIIITDNGLGFITDANAENGFGLGNLKKRAEEINGSLVINSQLNRGTQVTVIV